MDRRRRVSRRFSSQLIVSPAVVIDGPASGGRGASGGRRSHRTRREDVSEPCYFVDGHGRQHFNFPQRVWLEPSVPMAFTPMPSTALQTLAVNLLTLVVRERDYQAAVGTTARRAIDLAPEFIRDCLLGAPDQAWELPRDAIKAWVDGRKRTGSIRSRSPDARLQR